MRGLEAEVLRDERREVADALDVLGRLVIACLDGGGEAAHRLLLRALQVVDRAPQLGGALLDHLLEALALVALCDLELAPAAARSAPGSQRSVGENGLTT